jgi:hypothetical protein
MKAYFFHYDGGVLQARDDSPSLVRLLEYGGQENEIYSYAPASVHKAH